MAGVEAGTAEVGYFVVFKASFTEGVTHQGVHSGAEVVIGRNQSALITERLQGGVLLIGEAVG